METKRTILKGHTSIETAYKVDDYPYGSRLRTSIFYWIETKRGKGDRFCTCTIDPRNGKMNNAKKTTYYPFIYMYVNEDGNVKRTVLDAYDVKLFRERFEKLLPEITPITEAQSYNIRRDYGLHMYVVYYCGRVKYTEAKQAEYKEWILETLSHIERAPIEDICNHAPAPEQDNTEGENKFTIREYKIKGGKLIEV
jgi:hypothetical protein